LCLLAPGAALGEPVLNAMEAELARSMEGLRLPGTPPPYFVAYRVTSERAVSATAAFGALISSSEGESRGLAVDLRVGDYDLDSSYFSSGWTGGAVVPVPLDDHPMALRQALWLASDRAYKQALEDYAAKSSLLTMRGHPPRIPDLMPAPSVQSLDPLWEGELNRERVEALARKASAVFRERSRLDEAEVSVAIGVSTRWFVSSEGVRLRTVRPWFSFEVLANARSLDRRSLYDTDYIYGRSPDALPSDADALELCRQMADRLRALASAPLEDNYLGPVLFVDAAAPHLIAQTLGRGFLATPPVEAADEWARILDGRKPYLRRLGRLVLPRWVDLVDDPGVEEVAGEVAIGGYRFDDEGIQGQRVTLVEDGIQRALLIGRNTRSEVPLTNGHGRSGQGEETSAGISVMQLQARRGKSRARLERKMLALCREQGLPYGLVVHRLNDESLEILAGGGLAEGYIDSAMSSDSLPLTHPVRLERLYLDGRREWVRGGAWAPVTPSTVRHLMAAGRDPHVFNYYMEHSTGVLPVTAVAPDLLFEELELRPSGAVPPPPRVAPSPMWGP
jgi:hypothetical protein